MRNHSYENDFDLRENETARRTHCHKKGFALRLVLKQRHKGTQKWPIEFCLHVYLHANHTFFHMIRSGYTLSLVLMGFEASILCSDVLTTGDLTEIPSRGYTATY